MQRRTFIQTLTALIAAPAMPVTATAAPHITQHFARAKLLARCHDRASPEMLGRLMQLDTDTAHSVFTMLKDRNVIGQGIDGITRSMNPLNTHCVPNEAVRARDMAQMASDIAKRLREMAKRRLEDDATEHTPDVVDDVAPDTKDAT